MPRECQADPFLLPSWEGKEKWLVLRALSEDKSYYYYYYCLFSLPLPCSPLHWQWALSRCWFEKQKLSFILSAKPMESELRTGTTNGGEWSCGEEGGKKDINIKREK